ncbi:hypothetical protein SAMD00019534_011450 [Acytostelium subglobosum LB1]|uniref:hypothetical protein n=1 Tax=Acytostelium subglobosum LB1 TaxID=1410327 RepID=UPI000644F86A|nr:hypothetical protein SAMD00019534_011450 [Acytostelium subglobosum LB1]GAM17970.1 hypothetical protein SAMD00019534_011450 [Acytostelium subglobosum LB1]|eukprot:XP_012758566.1 hypothetical protein SAMD00019534_011450 [Acytostelium subglobosum LB1]
MQLSLFGNSMLRRGWNNLPHLVHQVAVVQQLQQRQQRQGQNCQTLLSQCTSQTTPRSLQTLSFQRCLLTTQRNHYTSLVSTTGNSSSVVSTPTATASATDDNFNLQHHLAPLKLPVYRLEVRKAFNTLTGRQRLYAHYYSQAAWWGSLICLGQTSVESLNIFRLLLHLFTYYTPESLRKATVEDGIVTNQEYEDLLQYSAQFFGNIGNYLSFGDSKFIPRIPKDRLHSIIKFTKREDLLEMWNSCGDLMYSLEPRQRELGLEEQGLSTYYSPDIKRSEIDIVQEYLDSKSISGYNTRLFKKKLLVNNKSSSKTTVYQVLVASADKPSPTAPVHFKGLDIQLVYGDWNHVMKKVIDNLQEARSHVANDIQLEMTDKYIESFKTGSIDAHKDSQRWWVKDISPVIETNIGFIESYRDPYGVRGEFEGFVSIVNKELSKKLSAMIDRAEQFISLLPWPRAFEKEEFKRPDFTSLEVLTFASSGVPGGINIPNYDDIRQNEGFKNVSLGNVIPARKDERVTFISDSDQSLYNKAYIDAFEIQVAIHELFGHGTGKLLTRNENGQLNFDPSVTLNPLVANRPVDPRTDVYLAGETYDSKFKSLGSAMEECRAECVGIYLCVNRDLLSLFGHVDHQKALDVIYINWLSMARAGVCALEFYSPSSKSFKQAHMHARFAILQVLLRAGNGLITLDTSSNNDIILKLDRNKIESVGVPAIGAFLTKLMVLKSTGNVSEATKLFEEYTNVSDEYLALRDIVMEKKVPRKVFVQAHTFVNVFGSVDMLEFEDNCSGMIESMTTRFSSFYANTFPWSSTGQLLDAIQEDQRSTTPIN